MMEFSSEIPFDWEENEEMSEEREEEFLLFGLEEDSVAKEELKDYTEKFCWPELKEKLNFWGKTFSESGSADRILAVEQIFKLLEDHIFEFRFSKSKALFENANAIMHAKFIGEMDSPIRFLRRIYPRKVFFDAVLYTLGFITKEGEDPSRAASHAYRHDHEKGAQYVTYLNTMLHFFPARRREELNRSHSDQMQLFPAVISQNEAIEEESTLENEVIARNMPDGETDALASLAELCYDKMHLDHMLVIGDGKVGKEQKVKAKTLQLFYSFRLVNFSRHATSPVSERTDRILMRPAVHEFLFFTTELKEVHYQSLVRASLSEIILNKKLYDLEDGKKVLQQAAVAEYLGKEPNTVSDQFSAVVRYLVCHWNYPRF